jgi:transcription antitermination factor NusB
MGKRRRSRELALQLLYQLDVHGDADAALKLEDFWTRNAVDPDVRAFAEALVVGTKKHQATIDELISRFTEHWSLDRMAVVDRNILRQSVFELLWGGDVPPRVAINEALEVAKKFSTQESSRFINGVLDRIHREVPPASS